MKKIFTLIAVAAMALSANAQKVVDFTGMKSVDEYTIANASLNSGSTDTKKQYDIQAGDVLDWNLNTAEDIHFQITNSSAKAKIFVVNLNGTDSSNKASAEFGGSNGIVIFNTINVGDVIKMNVAAKGSTDANIGVLPSSGNDLITTTVLTLPKKDSSKKGTEGYDDEGYAWKEFSFTVTEDMLKSIEGVKVVRVKETKAGYRCKAIAINADLPTGIETVKAAKAAQNGATYNVAGQQVDTAYKGLVIKNGKKVVNK